MTRLLKTDNLITILHATGCMFLVWKIQLIINSIIILFQNTLIESFLTYSSEFIKYSTSVSILTLTIIKIIKELKSKQNEKHS